MAASWRHRDRTAQRVGMGKRERDIGAEDVKVLLWREKKKSFEEQEEDRKRKKLESLNDLDR